MDNCLRSRLTSIGFTLLFAIGSAGPALAQTAPQAIVVASEGTLQELVLRDGSRAIGRVVKVDAGRVTFRTDAGASLDVDESQILSLGPARGRIEGGSFWREDSNPTRLFFGPTGRQLRRGQAYFGLYEVWLPFVQVGVTDRFSIGAGTPILTGVDYHPIWLTPKFQIISTPTTQVSTGVMHFFNVQHESFGVGYVALTHGSTDDAATVGVGWAYSKYKPDTKSPVFMLGGERRVSPHFKVVTENYAIDGHLVLSVGFRFLGERLTADLGLVGAPEGFPVMLPMVNFVWKLTK